MKIFSLLKIILKRVCVLSLMTLSLAVWAKQNTLLVYGDSLSAGYGISTAESWPTLLANQLKESGYSVTVANASISGETTAGGRARFDGALKQFKPTIVILALGANDGLRGLPVSQMKDNLSAMIVAATKRGAKVMLIGMRMPPNYGPDYTRDFESTFRKLAKEKKVALLPFMLEPIATRRDAFQADGLHPTAAVQPELLAPIWSALKPLLAGMK